MSPSMRKPLIAGNWKMNLDRDDVENFCSALDQELPKFDTAAYDAALFPASLYVAEVAKRLEDHGVWVGGQDCHQAVSGAFTGDVSAQQLADVGARVVLAGHSERRLHHRESPQLVADKVSAAHDAGLVPFVCIGESLAERESDRTEDVLIEQLLPVREVVSSLGSESWVLAYEPVWAIGTGKTATPEIAQEVHSFLRRQLSDWELSASSIRILYGGSVKSSNCEPLLEEPDIDGFLIGGASLDPGSFLDIIDRCADSS